MSAWGNDSVYVICPCCGGFYAPHEADIKEERTPEKCRSCGETFIRMDERIISYCTRQRINDEPPLP
jgi:hypothetical protein